jgi:peptidoglycan-associated lipoprotein
MDGFFLERDCMKATWWKYVLLGVMVSSIAATGCKKRPKGGGEFGDDNLAGVIGTPIEGDALSGRFGPGTDIRESQFTPVYFEYDSAQISPSERPGLEEVANYMRQNQSGLVVEGHCDERGSREYNLALGERRALAVRAYLVGLGVDGSLIQTKSLGEEQPAAMGHDDESWRLNRRAEFYLAY